MADDKIKVMIVDDSAIIRGLLQRELGKEKKIEVISNAFNGSQAISVIKASPVKPDIILLDIEMPEMDGMTALPKLLEISPTSRIIMVSTITKRNAEISLRALELGASDYIAKPESKKDADDTSAFYRELIEKITVLAGAKSRINQTAPLTAIKPAEFKPVTVKPLEDKPKLDKINVGVKYPTSHIKALAIGSSTGGPQALATLFKALKDTKLPDMPIFITQHMPATFTTILAQHLAQITGRVCVEGKDGDVVEQNKIYIAPGDYHMMPEKKNEQIIIKINQNPPVNFCRPSVDPMLQALVNIYGKNILTVILTGMGSDGLGGSKTVVAVGGTVIAQDENSSVVWGMPRAVAENNLCSAILPLNDIAPYIVRACQ